MGVWGWGVGICWFVVFKVYVYCVVMNFFIGLCFIWIKVYIYFYVNCLGKFKCFKLEIKEIKNK